MGGRAGPAAAGMLSPDLVWIAGVPWDDPIVAVDRHMATELTRYARVLWVDPPVSPVRAAGHRMTPAFAAVSDRLIRLTPAALPGPSRPGIRLAMPALLRAQIGRAVRRAGGPPSAVVATYLSGVLGGWGPGAVNVLYGTDDYVAGAGLMGLSRGRLRKLERRDLARADVVVALSPPLADRWRGLGADPVVIPNGCTPPAGPPARPAAGLPPLPRPVAGLAGQLSGRIDMAVLEAIAAAGLSLLLVGPLDPRWEPARFADLVRRPRVHYAGAVPSAAVGGYLAAMDVGITPYRDTPFNQASFPLKTLDYLAAGLPVVSADLPAARWLLAGLRRQHAGQAGQVLALARDSAQYVAGIRGLAAAAGPGRAATCAAFARSHDWTHRAAAFAAAIGLEGAR